MGGLKSATVKRGIPHFPVQLVPHCFTPTSTAPRLVTFYYQVYVSSISSSFWVCQEGCVQSLYLNMLPAGSEAEDTECV